MGKKERNFQEFVTRHPGIYEAYEAYGKALHEQGGPLDERQRWLVKVAVSAAGGHELALKTHIRKAMAAGCRAEEIEHAILLTAPTVGFPVMMTAFMTLREELAR